MYRFPFRRLSTGQEEIRHQLEHGGYSTPPGAEACAEERAKALIATMARPDVAFTPEKIRIVDKDAAKEET
jgi:hypothetical protein